MKIAVHGLLHMSLIEIMWEAQAPLLAYNHFVEAVFVLNECRAGLQASGPLEEPPSQALGSEEAAGAFSLAGPSSRGKRDTIYRWVAPRAACLTHDSPKRPGAPQSCNSLCMFMGIPSPHACRL